MAQNLLDKASYSVVRTNPKLTGNVKVVSDGTDIYLESFSANTRLSSQRYKAFKVDGSNTYDQDVFRFFNSISILESITEKHNFKKAFLLVAGSAMEKLGNKISEEQELMMKCIK